jgi:hypothetical protein
MNYKWDYDARYPDDLDLRVHVAEDDWHLIAFIRYRNYGLSNAHYVCRFTGMDDYKFPDGKEFKTKQGAKNFCERHLPAMWIRHCANTGDDE